MGLGLYWIYAFNLIVNSVLSFFTTVLLIELFLCVLRIRDARVKVFCRFLPFCKICLDLFLYHFSNWALMHEVNPLLAETGTRRLSIMVKPWMGIQLSMHDGKTFSVADVIALSVDAFWIQVGVSIAVIGMVIALVLKLLRILRCHRQIDCVVSQCVPLLRLPLIPSLVDAMKKKEVKLSLTSAMATPCIIGKTILFPVDLIDALSQEEFEAVIAHEMAHLQWRDCALRCVYSLVAALFWWIPTGWLQRRIEELQEVACDSMIHRWGISKWALAQAILKTARKTRSARSELVLSFVERPSSLQNRMQMLLQEPVPQALKCKTIRYGLLCVSLLSIVFGKMWLF